MKHLALIALAIATLCLESVFSAPAYAAAPIRVVYGFDREFPPFSYQDAGGKPVGFEVELIETIFRDKATLSLRPLNWYGIPLELSSGTITMTSGMIRTPQRARLFSFSDDSTFDLKVMFFTKLYKRVPNSSYLRGQRVSVEEKSYAQAMLKDFGGVNIKPYPSRHLALRALYNDEVDAYCGLDEPSYYQIRRQNYGAITTLGVPLATTKMRVAVQRDRGDVLRMFNDGLKELKASGEYDRIYRKWFITELNEAERDSLVKEATKASISAYAPYGGKGYGAAILTATGKIYTGCNVENADPAVNTSALRHALSNCVAAGDFEIRAAVTVDQEGKIIAPVAEDCQALYEFGRGVLVVTPARPGPAGAPMVCQLLPNPVSKNIFVKEPAQ